MKHNKLHTAILIVLSLAFLAGSAWMLPAINGMREQYKLEMVNPLDKNQKDLVAEFKVPTMALFTFRTLAINYLWIRADNLKNEGQFFDANYLARAICALQPNLDKVWDFQGWNMAYNISVELPTAPERWDWVRAGFELLRDQGLLHAPHSLQIHWSIAWIFQHKIGGITDDFHRYYKLRLAYEMMPLLTPIYSKRLLARPTNQELQKLAEVPVFATWENMWEDLAGDPETRQLIDNLRKLEPKLITNEELRKGLLDFRLHPSHYSEDLFHFMNQANDENKALYKLDTWLRATCLRRQWKLDPAFMLELNKKYGPVDYNDDTIRYSLDWRTPYAHALYWASQGLKIAMEQKPDVFDFDRIRLHRVVYHSLQDMYHFGNLTILVAEPPEFRTDRETGQELSDKEIVNRLRLYNTQDLRMFWSAYNAMLELNRLYQAAGEDEPGGVEDASAYLARASMQNLYLADHRQAAQRILNHLTQRFPDDKTYQDTLDNVVVKLMRDEIESISPRYGSNYVLGLLRASYSQYGMGNDEQAAIREQFALKVFAKMEKENWGNPDDDPTKRVELTLPNLRWTALMDLLYDASVDDEVKTNLISRIKDFDPNLYDRVIQELIRFQEEREKDRLDTQENPDIKAPENDANLTPNQP